MEQLKLWRDDRHLSQADLQYAARVDTSQLSRYERGHDVPNLCTLGKLVFVLDKIKPISGEEIKALVLGFAFAGNDD
jgi:transcriptional regulator with XRE-family HTH domain